MILQNNTEIAQASSAEIIDSDWDAINALFDREAHTYSSKGIAISDSQINEIFMSAWLAQNDVCGLSYFSLAHYQHDLS